MIKTTRLDAAAATVLHVVTGKIGRRQAEQGAAAALHYVQQLHAEVGRLNLVLDLRGQRFADLSVHKLWSQGFARNPALQQYIRLVAIVGDDTPAFRGERELLETAEVRFFTDVAAAQAWLDGTLVYHEAG